MTKSPPTSASGGFPDQIVLFNDRLYTAVSRKDILEFFVISLLKENALGRIVGKDVSRKTEREQPAAAEALFEIAACGAFRIRFRNGVNAGADKRQISAALEYRLEAVLKAGTYTFKANVTAAGNSNYRPVTKTVSLTITVK